MEKIPQAGSDRREKRFILLSVAAAAILAVLAFYFAVPLRETGVQPLPEQKSLTEYVRVDLNTADMEALCTLPGVGESRARAIMDYRQQYGAFARVEDAAEVPGLTQDIVSSWEDQAYVS